MSLLIQVIVRAVVVGGVGLLVGYLADLAGPRGGGANIGAGLLAFLGLLLSSLIWAFVDGRRTGAMGRWIAIWAAVALLVALAMVLQIQLHGSGVDTEVLRSDMKTVGPFIFGLVFVPATVGAVVGSLLSTRTAPPA